MQHWLSTILEHSQLGGIINVVDVYMPINYGEKMECWETLTKLSDNNNWKNSIVASDFNTTL
jgi:hypothetical protein